jgi:endo-1,3(4)-beta-glucanase
MVSSDIFQLVATDAPPAVFTTRPDHPVPRLGIVGQDSPIGTNKFYANFFLGSQTAATWTHPYSVAWARGRGASGSWGMSIQHIDENQKVFGPNPTASTVQYFINPIGIQSLVLSAVELGTSTSISVDTVTAFSANVNLLPSTGAAPAVTFPLVQGMAFVTGIYNGAIPILQTGVFFRSLFKIHSFRKSGVTKYVITLEDGKMWLLYAYSPVGNTLELVLASNSLAQSSSSFNGIVQIAKLPVGSPQGGPAEQLYDMQCGVYPTTARLSGKADGLSGSYTLSFDKGGTTDTILTMFALPHHVESFSPDTRSGLTSVQLPTTTKGMATAVVADSWTLFESLPKSIGFAPWNPSSGHIRPLSTAAVSAMRSIAADEISQDMGQQTNLNSMYFSGKV